MVTEHFLTFPAFSRKKIIFPNRKNLFPIWNFFFQFFQVQNYKGTMKFQMKAILWG